MCINKARAFQTIEFYCYRADRVHVFCIEGGLAIFMRASLDCKSCIFSFYWQKYQIKLLKLIENAEKASF